MAINLNFSDQQRLIQDSARTFFSEKSPRSLARSYERDPTLPHPDTLWSEMAEMGWLGMCLPMESGGLSCSFMDMIPLYIEMGKNLVSSAHLESVGIASALINELGTESQKSLLLTNLIAGKDICTVGIFERSASLRHEDVTLRAERKDDGFLLNGAKHFVTWASSASHILLPARSGEPGSERGITLLIIPLDSAGISIKLTPGIAGTAYFSVSFDNVGISRSCVLGKPGEGWEPFRLSLAQAAVLQSAMVWGAGEAVLDLTTSYAKERKQFGVPIGKYQAVQYLCTDIALEVSAVRLLTLQAAWRIDTQQEFVREANMVCAAACKAAASMTFAAHEVHAGVAFIEDYDLQLYTRRAKHWEFYLGDRRHHLNGVMREGIARTPFQTDVLSVL